MHAQKRYQKITRAAYDLVAGEYAKRDQCVVPETFEVRAALRCFVRLLPRHATVLDVGSGAGRDSRFLHDRGLRVIGIDFSPRMVAVARKINPRIRYQIMDIEQLKFKVGMFDGVWANASLHHIPKKRLKKVLSKIYIVLRSGGIFFVKLKYGKGERMRANITFGKPTTRYFAFYHIRELSKLMRTAGFKILSAHTDQRQEWIDIFAKKRKT